MAETKKNIISERITHFLKAGSPSPDQSVRSKRRERIAVFIFAYFMALSLWFIVNLNSEYRITINIPIELGGLPPNMALVDSLPESLQVEVSGDGWKLVTLNSNPPEIPINVVEGEVNVFEQVRQRLTVEQNVNVLKVSPLFLNIGLESRISKKIPVQLVTQLSFEDRYGLVKDPVYQPDSITITGAQSHVNKIERWIIPDILSLNNIHEDITQIIEVSSNNPLLDVDVDQITFSADVSEFTEGEVSVYIRTRDIPRGSIINYNPSTVTIKFDVPIDQYANIENQKLYEVYVPYDEILEDITGFVTPDIELIATDFKIKLRSFQPKAVAYFSVLDE